MVEHLPSKDIGPQAEQRESALRWLLAEREPTRGAWVGPKRPSPKSFRRDAVEIPQGITSGKALEKAFLKPPL
jgi:hypothetical protein